MPVKGILKSLLLLVTAAALIAASMAFAGQAQAAPKSGKAVSNTAAAFKPAEARPLYPE